MGRNLKLLALDLDDVEVISAALEGAITSPGEMSFDRTSRHFMLTSSRVRWEDKSTNSNEVERTRCGLLITDVTNIRAKNIPQQERTMTMELLSIACQVGDDLATTLHLNFAGDKTIEIAAECVNLALTDAGESWKTHHIPTHDVEN